MSLDVTLSKYCECCGTKHEVYDANITHNLGEMAGEAGIYQALWRPEEIGIEFAKELIEPLTDGLNALLADPAHFEKFNSENGWGMYEHFVPFVRNYLEACKKNPKAKVETDR